MPGHKCVEPLPDPLRPVGAPCDPNDPYGFERGYGCPKDAYCDAPIPPTQSPLCTLYRGLGEICAAGNGATAGACLPGAFCDGRTARCEPKLPVGSIADSSYCASGATLFDLVANATRCVANPYEPGYACLRP
jgi:hypothetical protein